MNPQQPQNKQDTHHTPSEVATSLAAFQTERARRLAVLEDLRKLSRQATKDKDTDAIYRSSMFSVLHFVFQRNAANSFGCLAQSMCIFYCTDFSRRDDLNAIICSMCRAGVKDIFEAKDFFYVTADCFANRHFKRFYLQQPQDLQDKIRYNMFAEFMQHYGQGVFRVDASTPRPTYEMIEHFLPLNVIMQSAPISSPPPAEVKEVEMQRRANILFKVCTAGRKDADAKWWEERLPRLTSPKTAASFWGLAERICLYELYPTPREQTSEIIKKMVHSVLIGTMYENQPYAAYDAFYLRQNATVRRNVRRRMFDTFSECYAKLYESTCTAPARPHVSFETIELFIDDDNLTATPQKTPPTITDAVMSTNVLPAPIPRVESNVATDTDMHDADSDTAELIICDEETNDDESSSSNNTHKPQMVVDTNTTEPTIETLPSSMLPTSPPVRLQLTPEHSPPSKKPESSSSSSSSSSSNNTALRASPPTVVSKDKNVRVRSLEVWEDCLHLVEDAGFAKKPEELDAMVATARSWRRTKSKTQDRYHREMLQRLRLVHCHMPPTTIHEYLWYIVLPDMYPCESQHYSDCMTRLRRAAHQEFSSAKSVAHSIRLEEFKRLFLQQPYQERFDMTQRILTAYKAIRRAKPTALQSPTERDRTAVATDRLPRITTNAIGEAVFADVGSASASASVGASSASSPSSASASAAESANATSDSENSTIVNANTGVWQRGIFSRHASTWPFWTDVCKLTPEELEAELEANKYITEPTEEQRTTKRQLCQIEAARARKKTLKFVDRNHAVLIEGYLEKIDKNILPTSFQELCRLLVLFHMIPCRASLFKQTMRVVSDAVLRPLLLTDRNVTFHSAYIYNTRVQRNRIECAMLRAYKAFMMYRKRAKLECVEVNGSMYDITDSEDSDADNECEKETETNSQQQQVAPMNVVNSAVYEVFKKKTAPSRSQSPNITGKKRVSFDTTPKVSFVVYETNSDDDDKPIDPMEDSSTSAAEETQESQQQQQQQQDSQESQPQESQQEQRDQEMSDETIPNTDVIQDAAQALLEMGSSPSCSPSPSKKLRLSDKEEEEPQPQPMPVLLSPVLPTPSSTSAMPGTPVDAALADATQAASSVAAPSSQPSTPKGLQSYIPPKDCPSFKAYVQHTEIGDHDAAVRRRYRHLLDPTPPLPYTPPTPVMLRFFENMCKEWESTRDLRPHLLTILSRLAAVRKHPELAPRFASLLFAWAADLGELIRPDEVLYLLELLLHAPQFARQVTDLIWAPTEKKFVSMGGVYYFIANLLEPKDAQWNAEAFETVFATCLNSVTVTGHPVPPQLATMAFKKPTTLRMGIYAMEVFRVYTGLRPPNSLPVDNAALKQFAQHWDSVRTWTTATEKKYYMRAMFVLASAPEFMTFERFSRFVEVMLEDYDHRAVALLPIAMLCDPECIISHSAKHWLCHLLDKRLKATGHLLTCPKDPKQRNPCGERQVRGLINFCLQPNPSASSLTQELNTLRARLGVKSD